MPLGSFSGAGLSMGVTFTLVDNFSAVADRIQLRLDRLHRSVTGLGRRIGNAGNQINNALNGTSNSISRLGTATNERLVQQFAIQQTLQQMLHGARRVMSFYGDALDKDATFQNIELAFRSFLGTAEEAHRVFEQVKQDAIKNPVFSIEGMEKAALMFISQEVAADKAMEAVKDLSTVLLGVGGGQTELQNVAVAMEKIRAAGVMDARVLRSFDSARIPLVKLLEDYKGIARIDRTAIKSYGFTFEDVTGAIHKSIQAGEQFGAVMSMLEGNVSAAKAQIKESFTAMLADIGKAFRPLTLIVLDIVGRIVNGIRELMSTEVGAWIARITLAIAVLSTVLIGLGFAWASATLAVNALSAAFGVNTQAVILNTLAQRGLMAALVATGRAALVALRPLLLGALAVGIFAAKLFLFYKLMDSNRPILQAFGVALILWMGPLGWIAGAITLVVMGLRSFKDAMAGGEVRGGFMGTLQKIGGTFMLLNEMFGNYNEMTRKFSISAPLYDTLKKMGMEEFAKNMATWVGRLIELWKGFKTGVKEAFKEVAKGFLFVYNMLVPVNDQISDWNDLISKATSNMDAWRESGRFWGKVFMYFLTGAAIGFTVLAIQSVAAAVANIVAWWPVYLVFLLIIGTIIFLYQKYKEFSEYQKKGDVFGQLKTAATSLLGPLGMIIESMEKIFKLSAALVGPKLNPLSYGSADDYAEDMYQKSNRVLRGFNYESNQKAYKKEWQQAKEAERGQAANMAAALGNAKPVSSVTNTTQTKQPVVVQVMVDNSLVAEKVLERLDLEKSLINVG